jgi:hypothetical protein
MQPKTDRGIHRLFVALACAALVFVPGVAFAASAPKHLLDDPLALKAFLGAELARNVNIVHASYGDDYMRFTTQDANDPDIYDEYRVSPGNPLKEPEPQKVNSINCKKHRLPWAQFDLVAGRAALLAAQDIATANGYQSPTSIEWGPDVFCKAPGWRSIMFGVENDEEFLELVFTPQGEPQTARKFLTTKWQKVKIADLRRGASPAAAKPARAAKLDIKSQGLQLDFARDPGAAVKLLEAALQKPLPLIMMNPGSKTASFVLLDGKELVTYIVGTDGSISEFNRQKLLPLECAKPFAANAVPIARLPELIETARRSVPPMRNPRVSSVRITHSGFCGAPHVYVQMEDDRATADAEFDARGRMIKAGIRRVDADDDDGF